MKKLISMILVIAMALGTFALPAFAAEGANVAKVGDAEYATLSAAFAAANQLGTATVEILKDFNFDSTKEITVTGNVTLSGAHTISRGAYAKTMFTVNKGATFTLDGNVTLDGSNNWVLERERYEADLKANNPLSTETSSYTTSNGTKATAQMISIASGGTVIMNNATIQNSWSDKNNDGAPFKIPAGATLITNEGSLITHIRSSVVGQVSGTWTMNGGKINDVFGHSGNGGVVDIRNSGVVTVNGGEITGVRTLGLNANGNGIFAQVYGENAKLYITGGDFHDNASFAPGGGWGAVVYLNRGGDFKMTGGIIRDTLSSKCSAFVANNATSIELLGGTIQVDPSTGASFDSLFYGNVTIGADMKIVGTDDSTFYMLGDAANTLVINGNVSGGVMQLHYSKPVTGTGVVTSDVLIEASSYFGTDGKVTLAGASWLNSVITVNSVGSAASLTVDAGTEINGVQVRVLESVESGYYTNATESAAAIAAVYTHNGGVVGSPVLFYHRLTAAQQTGVVVTYDYNGGKDAQGWSGCQTLAGVATPVPVMPGYVVSGWNYAVDNNPESLSMESTVAYNGEEITSNVRLIAQWRKPDYVCYIVETGVYYETLTAAVADANASAGADTIVMIKSIDFDSAKALTVTGDLTIKGAYTISRGAYTGTLFTVPAGSSLTLDGGITFDGSNNWIFNKDLYEYDLYNRQDNAISAYAYSAEGGTCGTAAVFVVNGTVTVNNATIQNFFNTKDSNAGDGAIFKVGANATLTTDGATIDHVCTYGANAVAHLATNSKWYIKGDTMISNNFAGRNGGLCRNDSGQIYMDSGTIKNTAGKNVNGSVFMMYGSGSAFYMYGGTICGNSSVFGVNNGRCAAIYLHSSSYMKMTGGTICHNVGGSRGGIDSYSSNSVLDINRCDQDFVDGVYANENGNDAYTESNHPMIVDNVSLIGYTSHDVGRTYSTESWWVTGGIYTQDVDNYCAPGYICIPYADTERTDDYIVVPGYRVKYYSVEKVVTTDPETGAEIEEIVTTLVKKYFHMLPRDKYWYEMDEKAESYTVTDENGNILTGWYTEQELVNLYDFDTKLEGDLTIYGEWVEPKPADDYIITYDTNEDSGKAYLLYVDKAGNVVDFTEMKGKHSPVIVKGREDLVAIVYIPKANSGWLWSSEPISDEIADIAAAYLKKNVPSYKAYGAQATGLGEFELKIKKQTYTYNVDLYTVVEDETTVEPVLNVTVDGADIAEWTVTKEGVTAIYIAANGKVPAVLWTSEAVSEAELAAIAAELGAPADATVISGLGSHDIEYQHNKNKTKTVTYKFS